jgi:hypothetical protein
MQLENTQNELRQVKLARNSQALQDAEERAEALEEQLQVQKAIMVGCALR